MSSSLLPRGLRVNVASANGDASAASPSPSDNGTELHVRRLRGFVLEALRRDPRLRVVELTPDGRRCAVSVAGVGLVHLEIRPPENRRTCPLTPRELDVLRAAADGLSNEEIGRELTITAQTVKFHLANIFRKLEVANRTEATRYACQMGLI